MLPRDRFLAGEADRKGALSPHLKWESGGTAVRNTSLRRPLARTRAGNGPGDSSTAGTRKEGSYGVCVCREGVAISGLFKWPRGRRFIFIRARANARVMCRESSDSRDPRVIAMRGEEGRVARGRWTPTGKLRALPSSFVTVGREGERGKPPCPREMQIAICANPSEEPSLSRGARRSDRPVVRGEMILRR